MTDRNIIEFSTARETRRSIELLLHRAEADIIILTDLRGEPEPGPTSLAAAPTPHAQPPTAHEEFCRAIDALRRSALEIARLAKRGCDNGADRDAVARLAGAVDELLLFLAAPNDFVADPATIDGVVDFTVGRLVTLRSRFIKSQTAEDSEKTFFAMIERLEWILCYDLAIWADSGAKTTRARSRVDDLVHDIRIRLDQITLPGSEDGI